MDAWDEDSLDLHIFNDIIKGDHAGQMCCQMEPPFIGTTK
jgi:hypothetical protein